VRFDEGTEVVRPPPTLQAGAFMRKEIEEFLYSSRLSVNRREHPFYRHKMLILSQEKIEYINKTNYLLLR
jgi:hypothetical protein